MVDFIIGKAPTMNRHMDDEPEPLGKTVREMFGVDPNARLDRRKNTADRRLEAIDAYVVNLSNRHEKRSRRDRRQKQEILTARILRRRNRRKNQFDRRRSVNSGVIVKLSTGQDRRSWIDRRGNKPL